MSLSPELYQKNSIILLGMPGSGKTTLGKRLSKHYALPFIDTDHSIEASTGKPLQSILDAEGYLELRAIEERVLLSLDLKRSIVSTGGSAVYSDRGMLRLKTFGYCVYLNVPITVLLKRINNLSVRGIAAPENYTLDMIFSERELLYRRYADLIIDVEEESVDQTVEKLLKKELIEKDL